MKTNFFPGAAARVLAVLMSVLLGVASGTVISTVFAAPAHAHTSLKSSDPAKNAKVEKLERVELEFTQTVRLPTVIVRGPDGEDAHTGKPEVDGRFVYQDVADDLPAGKYTIAYRVVSPDGHPVDGEIPFTLVAAETDESPSAAPEQEEGASPDDAASTEPSDAAQETAGQDAAGQDAAGQETAGQETAGQDAAAQDASPASAEERSGGVPGWMWIVVFGLAGIGIGLAISLRPKKADAKKTGTEDR